MSRRPRSVVTGAGGFAGTWLCRELVGRGHAVWGWVRRPPARPVPGVRYAVVDITHADACAAAIARSDPQRVFHLAALTWPREAERQPERCHAVNVTGTANVFGALPPSARALYVSTAHVYGPPEALPLRSGQSLRPAGVYARSKAEGERVARAARPDCVIARSFHHSGPGQQTRFVLADWNAQVVGGQRRLSVGDLTIARDFLDVRDVVRAYRLILDRAAPGQTLNVCAGHAVPLGAILGWMVGGRPVAIEVDPARLRPGEVRTMTGDNQALRALGWRQRISLRQMVRDMQRRA